MGQAESSSRLSRRSSSHLFSTLVMRCLSGSSDSVIKTLLNEKLRSNIPVQIIHKKTVSIISQSVGRMESCNTGTDICSTADLSEAFELTVPVIYEKVHANDLRNDDLQKSTEMILQQPYNWWKRFDSNYNSRRNTFLSTGPFKLWLSDDPITNDQFPLKIPLNISSKERNINHTGSLQSVQKDLDPHISIGNSHIKQDNMNLTQRPSKKICMDSGRND